MWRVGVGIKGILIGRERNERQRLRPHRRQLSRLTDR